MKQLQHQKYYTYIVKCSDSSFYVGKTYDLVRRLKQHNGELSGGSAYTRSKRPVYLCYYEVHSTNKEACSREAYFKRLTHKQKEDFVAIKVKK